MNDIRWRIVDRLEYTVGVRGLGLANDCHALRCKTLTHGTNLFMSLGASTSVRRVAEHVREQLDSRAERTESGRKETILL